MKQNHTSRYFSLQYWWKGPTWHIRGNLLLIFYFFKLSFPPFPLNIFSSLSLSFLFFSSSFHFPLSLKCHQQFSLLTCQFLPLDGTFLSPCDIIDSKNYKCAKLWGEGSWQVLIPQMVKSETFFGKRGIQIFPKLSPPVMTFNQWQQYLATLVAGISKIFKCIMRSNLGSIFPLPLKIMYNDNYCFPLTEWKFSCLKMFKQKQTTTNERYPKGDLTVEITIKYPLRLLQIWDWIISHGYAMQWE